MTEFGPGNRARTPEGQVGDKAACGTCCGAGAADLFEPGQVRLAMRRDKRGPPLGGSPGIGVAQREGQGKVGQARERAVIGQGRRDGDMIVGRERRITCTEMRQHEVTPERRKRVRRGQMRRQIGWQAQRSGQQQQDRGGAGREGVGEGAQEAGSDGLGDRLLVALGMQDL